MHVRGHTTIQKFGVDKFIMLIYAVYMILKKYRKSSNIVKYYSLKCLFLFEYL